MTEIQVSDPGRVWIMGQSSDFGLDGLDTLTSHTCLVLPDFLQTLETPIGVQLGRNASATVVPQLGNPCLTGGPQACTHIPS